MHDLRTLAAAVADTPALVIDLNALEANAAAMTAHAAASGVALRPHAKTHKCTTLGARQLAAGAIGLCCAKLGELEVFAEAGCRGLLMTSPVWGAAKTARLKALAERHPGLMVVCDSPDHADVLASLGVPLDVLIDVDVGQHRTGVTSPEMAVEAARRLAAAPHLRMRGVQGYGGHLQHVGPLADRRRAAEDAAGILRGVRDALVEAGFPCPIVTGSGTGSHALDPAFGLFTELQVGSYLFDDVEYAAIEQPRPLRPALFVVTQVVSANLPGQVTVDAGSKSFSFDGPLPVVVHPPGAAYTLAGDEFGTITGAPHLRPGDRVVCQVPHCDPTVNLHDRYVCIRDGRVEAEWPIDARGRAD